MVLTTNIAPAILPARCYTVYNIAPVYYFSDFKRLMACVKIIIAFQKSITNNIEIMMVFLFTFYNFTDTSESRNIVPPHVCNVYKIIM